MERDKFGRFIKGHKQLNTGRTHIKKGQKLRLGAKHTQESKKKMSDAHKKIEHNIEGLLKHKPPEEEQHHCWKGDECGYSTLHKWVYKHKGKAQRCDVCGTSKWVEWANKSNKYKRDLDDWIQLCRKHHKQYDKKYKEKLCFLVSKENRLEDPLHRLS